MRRLAGSRAKLSQRDPDALRQQVKQKRFRTGARRIGLLTPASDQVIDQDDHRDDQHDVNQAAADVADESQ
jgi:hypothetical protein